jgi:hypothetical protein
MSRRDDLHFPVRRALEKEGWTITDDPLVLFLKNAQLKTDLGLERHLAAENGGRKIAVEVKDFDSASLTSDLQKMMGQIQLYQWALDEQEPDRELYLAISMVVYDERIRGRDSLFRTVVERIKINLMVIDMEQEVLLQWIKH